MAVEVWLVQRRGMGEVTGGEGMGVVRRCREGKVWQCRWDRLVALASLGHGLMLLGLCFEVIGPGVLGLCEMGLG